MSVEINAQTIRFVLDGETVAVQGMPATTTVLEYLREVAGRKGTKEGCAEGDCGACTVVLGELASGGRSIDYRAVNSCIRFLPTIDGRELVTVESLQPHGAPLHPVQQSMVDHHASQCGFCTPGFVMSLFSLYLNQQAATRRQVVGALAGNLCRCTGYRPIIEAGSRMFEYEEPAHWSRDDAQAAPRVQRLRNIQRGSRQDALKLGDFHAPRTVDDLAAALQATPDALILSGGTDVGLWVTKHLRELPPIVYIGEIAALKQIHSTGLGLWIGAAAPLSAVWPALVDAHPGLGEQARRFASPPICNSATLGGNVANGSPIGDSIPALIALGAEVQLRKGEATRRLPLEDFYLGYQQKDLRPGEFVVGLTVPAGSPQIRFASYKVSKRFEQDISAVSAGFAVTVQGERIADARLAFGGMAATPARARQAEALLIGEGWSAASIEAAVAALAEDFTPLTDMRASSAYRLQVAGNLLRRFLLQQKPGAQPLRTADVIERSEAG